ncbi:hypothetical protein CXB51_022071 [Gossypium anomalum]|uniref:Exocyst complex component Sec10 n=1 Tax=Gossypium anomalum TaxID=47600 RepID=A0A8J5YDR2_9ROSI|nr:hypothetical protein CXB51_022071 [Gossypium anomalum]
MGDVIPILCKERCCAAGRKQFLKEKKFDDDLFADRRSGLKRSKSSSVSNLPLILNIDDFKSLFCFCSLNSLDKFMIGSQLAGDFSFDALFGNLVNELLPSFQEDSADSADGHGIGGTDVLPNGHTRTSSDATKFAQGLSAPLFQKVGRSSQAGLFCNMGFDEICRIHINKEVSTQDDKHRKTLTELEKGVDGLFNSFARLDSRISSVGQTAAKVGDHLQSADAQRETASQAIELIKKPRQSDGTFTSLFLMTAVSLRLHQLHRNCDHSLRRIFQRLCHQLWGGATASRGLEVAVANLQEYCNGMEKTPVNCLINGFTYLVTTKLENRLLARFDAASQRRELSTMSECAKILSQFNRGTSAMQHYVATRPMFIDVEVMNSDNKLVLGDQSSQASPNYVARGLSKLYKEITDTVRKEAATIMAVFPSPNDVMSILVQRVLEQRVTSLLDKLLEKPSIAHPRPVGEGGGILLYLRMLAVAYEKTQELARDLRAVGCGDLDVEGLTESLFSAHKDEYPDYEQASLRQLYQAKLEELRAESQKVSEPSGTIGRSKGTSVASSPLEISVAAVTEFVRWNEEAITRCTLFSSLPATLAANVRSVFTCLLHQVSQYITDGLERARDSLTEAASLRERFVIGSSVSRRVTSQAEAAAAAGEKAVSNLSWLQYNVLAVYFANSISRLLLPVDGSHAAACEEMATAMSSAEGAAFKGLHQCIETVDRLLSAEQKAADYHSPDDGMTAFTTLEGLNKQAFLTELGNYLYKGLVNHWQKFTFNPSGGLRLKRDITEYGEFVRSFNAPTVDEKFELLGILANVFIVAPESLSSLFEGTPSIRKDAQSLEMTTRVRNWHPGLAPYGPVEGTSLS